MSAYLCTVSRHSPENWALCKQVGLWGIPGRKQLRIPVEVEDRLLVWVGGQGYVAEAVVTNRPRSPSSEAEVPWPGGTFRFMTVIPMKVATEVQTPIRFPFIGDKQAETGLSKTNFMGGFRRLPTDVSILISNALAAQASKERP